MTAPFARPKQMRPCLHDANWVRFRHQGKTGFGTLTQSGIIGA